MADLIDRQAAIDAVRSIKAITGTSDDKILLIDKAEVQTELMMLPTAEPKTGRWKSDRLVSTNGGTYGVRRCSACEAYFRDIGYGWNFCPNCGTKMGG